MKLLAMDEEMLTTKFEKKINGKLLYSTAQMSDSKW
jgi:hypothetical protein